MNRKILSWTLAMGVGIATGCGAARPVKYFQLTVPGDMAPTADAAPFPVSLALGRLASSHLYREDHIVYGSTGEDLGAYEYKRWAEPPIEMIDDVLLRELRATGRYRAVYPMGSDVRADYILHGHLYDFKELDGNTLVGRVTFELNLFETKTGAIVWTHFYTHDEPVMGKDISAVAAAVDRNVQRGVGEIRASLDQYFSAHFSGNSTTR